jgi:hypothetical protein
MRLLLNQFDDGNTPVSDVLETSSSRERERIRLHPYNRARRRARVPRAIYAAELRAWRSIFELLEAELSRRDDPAVRAIWDPSLARCDDVCRDLDRIDLRTHYIILKAQIVSERWGRALRSARPGELLGILFLLERCVPGGSAPHDLMMGTLRLEAPDPLVFRPRDPFGEAALEFSSRLDYLRDFDLVDEALRGCSGAISNTLELLDALSSELRGGAF